jgi:hypothetical protein
MSIGSGKPGTETMNRVAAQVPTRLGASAEGAVAHATSMAAHAPAVRNLNIPHLQRGEHFGDTPSVLRYEHIGQREVVALEHWGLLR